MNVFVLWLLMLGQQSISSATLGGQVTDSSGAPMAGVAITAVQVDRNHPFSTSTDNQGRYRFLSLPVGNYRVRAAQPGFAPYERTLTLTLGQPAELAIALTVGPVTSTVDVLETADAVDSSRTQIANTIFSGEIENLPLNGRNYLDLALLVPGVSKTNTGNNERFAETSAVPGTGISVAGQRNLGNTFVVDGLSANDDAADLAGTFFGQEVISEFQVVTSGGISEFGRASSGIVNVSTRSGTNNVHGDVYGFFRNHRFDATNIFAVVDPASGKRIRSPLTQGQYGASIGLPLRKNRTFLFTNFEREDLNRSGLVTITPANVAAINTVLDQVSYPAPRLGTGAYPTGDNRTSFFAKSDLVINQKTRLAVRYSLYDIFSPNARGVGGLNAISRGTMVDTRDQSIAANAVTSFSSTAINEMRAQFTRSRFAAPGNDLIGPAVNISGVANLGASTSSPTGRDIDAYEIADSYSLQKGDHFLKVGMDFIYDRVNIVFPASIYGTYSFSNLANFQAGTYTTFGQAFGKTDWFQTNPNVAWFVQDEWKIRKNLTANLGLRHDVQWLDASIQTRTHNFGPRVGLAYAPGKHHTVIRTGFGLYDDRIPLRAVANALRGAGTDYKSISLQRTQVGAPVFPNKLPAIPPGTLYNLATIDPLIQNGAGLQANLEIQRDLRHGMSLSGGYLYVRGLHIIMQRNLNVPTLTSAQDPVNLGRPNPNFGNITQYSGQGDSYYHGMTVSFEHRGSGWVNGRASYTLSKTIDNSGNAFFSSPQDNFNVRADRGLSDNDQRHRLTISGRLKVPPTNSGTKLAKVARGFQLSGVFTAASAYPFNVVTGGQTLQTTTARPTGVGRNTGRGFNSSTLDLRLSRRFRVSERLTAELMAESFNILNRANLQFPNNTFGAGTIPVSPFGLATSASDPRQIQFGLKLSY